MICVWNLVGTFLCVIGWMSAVASSALIAALAPRRAGEYSHGTIVCEAVPQLGRIAHG